MRLDRRSLLLVATALAMTAAVLMAPFGPGPAIVARITADTPEAQLDLFIGAVERGDIERARSLWVIPGGYNEPLRSALEARRLAVTEGLARARPASHTIERAQWWGTCCMPHVIATSAGAGGVRYRVSFAGVGGYVVDIFAMDTSWLYDGQPARGWAVRDVYPANEMPVYWTWSDDPPQ